MVLKNILLFPFAIIGGVLAVIIISGIYLMGWIFNPNDGNAIPSKQAGGESGFRQADKITYKSQQV